MGSIVTLKKRDNGLSSNCVFAPCSTHIQYSTASFSHSGARALAGDPASPLLLLLLCSASGCSGLRKQVVQLRWPDQPLERRSLDRLDWLGGVA